MGLKSVLEGMWSITAGLQSCISGNVVNFDPKLTYLAQSLSFSQPTGLLWLFLSHVLAGLLLILSIVLFQRVCTMF